jgi:hypothetical protein
MMCRSISCEQVCRASKLLFALFPSSLMRQWPSMPFRADADAGSNGTTAGSTPHIERQRELCTPSLRGSLVQGLAWGAPPDYDAQSSTAPLCNWQCVPVRPCSLGWKLRASGGVLYVREGGEGNECVSAQENPKPNQAYRAN